jgi:predicted ABC-type ATPase
MLKRRKPKKLITIIAGPNGAGKTTFAKKILDSEKRLVRFINADQNAQVISPRAPEKADFEAAEINDTANGQSRRSRRKLRD